MLPAEALEKKQEEHGPLLRRGDGITDYSRAGYAVADIAEMFNTSHGDINRAVRRAGGAKRICGGSYHRKRRMAERRAVPAALAGHDRGWSVAQIAAAIGMTRNRATVVLSDALVERQHVKTGRLEFPQEAAARAQTELPPRGPSEPFHLVA